ncbi:MAG: CheY-like chemotaxis protein, partial [Myxococcota bacterium]
MAKHTDSPTDGPDANAPERSRRILVVEEDRVEGGMLAFHLRREGLIVMLMAGEDEAIDAVAWAPPDAILIEKSGRDLDAFRVIRALGDAPVLVYLMADGPLALEDDLEALRLGVAHTFTKPLDPAQVASRLGARPMTPPRPRPVEVPDDGIAGDLELHPVTSLLQFCHRHRMNARVHIEMQDDWGVLLVRHGDVIDAESPGASGREAAYQAVSSANQGTFVLFPLALDAEELSRDDVVRADLATLVTEAFSKENAASQKAAQQAMPLQHADSPRGPLSRQTARTGPLKKLETLEYPAVRADDAGKQADAEEPSRARVRKQVGMPTVAPDAEAAEPQPTTDAPEQAAPKPETKPEAAPRTSRKSKRRRVPSDIARKQARIPTNPATATATATATKPPTQQQPVVEPSENTTIAGASSVVRVGPGSAAGSESHDAITTLKNAEAPTDAMLTAAVAAAREEQQGGDPRIGRMST